MENADPPLKPCLKWAGGKRQLLPEIKKHLPNNHGNYRYYEPFVGAGALFFDLLPARAVINDSNAELMLTYRAIREHVEELIELLQQHRDKNCGGYFYEIRNLDRDGEKFDILTNTERAARLIYLNKTCFNGLYRVNSRGRFNVPQGNYKNPAICEEALLRRMSRYLGEHDIDLLNGDFAKALTTAGGDSLVYLDPPYHSLGGTGFTDYGAGGFSEKEQERLRDCVVELTGRGAKCLLSNADTAYICGLYNYEFFDIIPLRAKRCINSDSSGRGSINEVLIKNWED
jgi:DNA adenine methylase